MSAFGRSGRDDGPLRRVSALTAFQRVALHIGPSESYGLMPLSHLLGRGALVLLAGAVALSAGCRKRGLSRDTVENLPPIEITEFNVDVRQTTCSFGVVEAAKAVKPALEKELMRQGFTVAAQGQGIMTAKGNAMVAGCKGDGGLATVTLSVFAHDGQRLARATRKAKLNGHDEGSGINSATAAAEDVVTLLGRSKQIRKYASQEHPDRGTAVALRTSTNDPPPPDEHEDDPPARPDPPPVVDPPHAPPPPAQTDDGIDAPPLNPDWVVAVMDVKDLNAGNKGAIGPDLIRNLGSQLRIFIAQRGAKTVDQSAQDLALRDQIKEMKNESYKTCYDDSCQIELGKALAASHILRSQVTRFGSRCVLNAELFDLRREVTIAASSSRGDCEPEGFLRMSQEVANGLRVQ